MKSIEGLIVQAMGDPKKLIVSTMVFSLIAIMSVYMIFMVSSCGIAPDPSRIEYHIQALGVEQLANNYMIIHLPDGTSISVYIIDTDTPEGLSGDHNPHDSH